MKQQAMQCRAHLKLTTYDNYCNQAELGILVRQVPERCQAPGRGPAGRRHFAATSMVAAPGTGIMFDEKRVLDV